MKAKAVIFFICCMALAHTIAAQDFNIQAAQALIGRVVPRHANQFRIEAIGPDNGKDVFEIASSNGQIVLRGNNPVSVASALNWYLKYICHAQLSWCGDNMALPARLPAVAQTIRKQTPYDYRAYLNYCTFSYSMPWWDWQRWEKEIDFMAMHGVNLPLAVVGQEAVWQNTLRQYGMTDQEIREFLAGPAYQAWQWMTNIESIYGPLPQNWIDRSVVLGKQIIARERELGMKTILQGFTGYVPVTLIEKQPKAEILKKPIWFYVGKGTAQLNPLDPLFDQMNKTFLEEQAKLFGTDHFYAADPFHEGQPPVKGDEYLAAVGKKIYEATSAVDPQAIIAMQTWSMRKPIVEAIPKNKILMLDLEGQKWKNSESFWGRPWLGGVIHNFGGNTAMGGDLNAVLNRFPALLNNKATGDYKGIGMFPEAIGHNPVIYEAASEMTWYPQKPDTKTWLHSYLTARYGRLEQPVQQAWEQLLETAYGPKGGVTTFRESAICARPALKVNGASPNGSINREKNYAFKDLWPALALLQQAGKAVKAKDTYRYDLVDLMRQCMADLAIPLQIQMADAYRNGRKDSFAIYSTRFLDLMDDFNTLLGSRKEFLLGKWIADARAIGKTTEEKALYEKNARGLITIWGPYDDNAIQYDYSARQWNGLVSTFYKVRWQKFIGMLGKELQKEPAARYQETAINHRFNRPKNTANDFYRMISKWEANWVETPAALTTTRPSGNEVALVKKMYDKWIKTANELYR